MSNGDPPYMVFIKENYLAFQFDIKDNPLVSTVGTTAVRVLTQNPNRVSIKMVNPSSNTIYVWTTADVSSTKGIVLTGNGGSLVLSVRSDDSLDLINEWWAVASGSSSAFLAREIFKVA